MTPIILCTAVAMNIYSMPAGSHIVGITSPGERVQLQDRSLLGDWVYIGDPGWSDKGVYLGARSRGWVQYANLACQ
jgi:hypothetical protein